MTSGSDDDGAGKGKPAPVLRPCPICGKLSIPTERPFCSRRCADIDLHRWLGGVYAIPVTHESDEDGERMAEGEE
jgi:endogenous inhibitor of DNA gyrase (YacG/DUF329 family)